MKKNIFLIAFLFSTSIALANDSVKQTSQKAEASSLGDLKEIVIALKPDKNPDQMLTERKSLETTLTTELGVPVKVIVPTSGAVILQGFANGTVDLGYLSSLDMVNAENANSAQVLLAGEIKGKTSYESIWLVKADSKLKSVNDLKGQPVAFASRTSTSGYLIPYWSLIKAGKLKEKEDPTKYFGEGNVWYGTGYVTAVQRVLDGTATAAAVSDYVYFGDKHLTPEQKAQVKVLQKQGPVPTHVIAARKTLNEKQLKTIKKALLAMDKNSSELRDKVFTSKLVEVNPKKHLASTREALNLTGLVIETK